jgi:hypothetical protein
MSTHYDLRQYRVNELYWDARFLMSSMPSNGRPEEEAAEEEEEEKKTLTHTT